MERYLPYVTFFAAVALAAWVLLRKGFRGGSRKDDAAMVRLPRPARERGSGDRAAELDRYEVQLHETARALSAQLDSKMLALNTLIRQADERLARLEEALPSDKNGLTDKQHDKTS